MNKLYFPVEKVPVEDICPGYEHPSGINHAIVVTQPDGLKRVVQYCSEIYHLVPNEEVIPPFEAEISRFFKIEKVIRAHRYARFYVDFILKEKSILIAKNDTIFPKVRLVNSYDGSIRYQFLIGFWRMVCSNGMMGYEYEGIKSMHTPKLGKETSYETVMEMTSTFMAEASDIAEVYRELNDQPVKDWIMRIEEVTEETDFPSSLQEDVTARMQLELDSPDVDEATDWVIYNAFNYQLNHNEGLKAKESKREVFDKQVLDYLLKY